MDHIWYRYYWNDIVVDEMVVLFSNLTICVTSLVRFRKTTSSRNVSFVIWWINMIVMAVVAVKCFMVVVTLVVLFEKLIMYGIWFIVIKGIGEFVVILLELVVPCFFYIADTGYFVKW